MLCNRAFARPCQLWYRACACESVPSGTRPRCSFTSTRWLNHRQLAWCGRPESNRHRPFGPRDFRTDYGFRCRASRSAACRRVCGLDYTFTLARPRLRCRPSSLYTFPCAFAPGLGSGLPVTGSPEFGQFCTSGFPAGTQAFKSLASTSSATPALALNLSIKALSANGKAQACESWRPQGVSGLPSFRGGVSGSIAAGWSTPGAGSPRNRKRKRRPHSRVDRSQAKVPACRVSRIHACKHTIEMRPHCGMAFA